jgi:L-ascorbate metabolism protein UlaG (beta-lactamase superfamily)
MNIKYLGHSSFFIRSKDAKLVTDPFEPKVVGLKFPKQEADIVTVSHQHGDHNYMAGISDDALVVDWPGEFEKKGIRIHGFNTYHDKEKGKERGENILYKIEADDMAILHCGDLGHVLDDDMLEAIGDIDILMIPVGGFFTIDAKEAVAIIKKIEPSIIIPMHYNHDQLNQETFSKIARLEEFIEAYGIDKTKVETVDQLTIKSDGLPEETKVVVMKIS